MFLLETPYLLFSLAWIAPELSFLGLNKLFFSRTQALASLAVALGVGLCSAWGLSFALVRVASLTALPYERLMPAAAGAAAILLAALLNRDLVRKFFSGWAFFSGALVLAGVFALAGWFLGLLPVTVLFGLYFLGSVLDCRRKPTDEQKNNKARMELAQKFGREIDKRQAEEQQVKVEAVHLKKKPNIYLLILESMHGEEALRRIYGQIGTGILSRSLARHGFTLCPHFISNALRTKDAVGMLFDMHQRELDQRGSHGEALSILKQNGYSITLADKAYFVYAPYLSLMDNTPFGVNPFARRLVHPLLPLFAHHKFLRKVTGVFDPFLTEDPIPQAEALDAFLRTKSSDTPQLFIARIGALHTDEHSQAESWKSDEWLRIYPELYMQGVRETLTMVETIIAADPEACIVAMGDHGAWRFRGALNEWVYAPENLAARGITEELIALDLFDSFCAIRLPHAPVTEPFSTVSLFRHLFAALAEDADLLSQAAFDTSFLFSPRGIHLVAHQGKFLEEWVKL